MKKTTNKTTKKPFHVIHFVEDSTPKMKKFNTIKALDAFKKKFEQRHKGREMDGYWVDYTITNIIGNVNFVDSYYQENMK